MVFLLFSLKPTYINHSLNNNKHLGKQKFASNPQSSWVTSNLLGEWMISCSLEATSVSLQLWHTTSPTCTLLAVSLDLQRESGWILSLTWSAMHRGFIYIYIYKWSLRLLWVTVSRKREWQKNNATGLTCLLFQDYGQITWR